MWGRKLAGEMAGQGMAWHNQELETGLRSVSALPSRDPGNEKKLDPRFRHSLGFLPTPLVFPGRTRGLLGVRGSSQSPISREARPTPSGGARPLCSVRILEKCPVLEAPALEPPLPPTEAEPAL